MPKLAVVHPLVLDAAVMEGDAGPAEQEEATPFRMAIPQGLCLFVQVFAEAVRVTIVFGYAAHRAMGEPRIAGAAIPERGVHRL